MGIVVKWRVNTWCLIDMIMFRNQVVTNACLLKEIDIQTMKKEDIPFDAPFSITVKRNDYIQVRKFTVVFFN